ncbi:hypothetical protein KAR91_01645 [Candidatus Pacearchaeota archaeon]|nr:hypothetical protein [Candidatus Pacearchaeota archaeon]
MAEILMRIVLTLGGILGFGVMLAATYGLFSIAIAPCWEAESDTSSRILNGFVGLIALIAAFVFDMGLCNILFNWSTVIELLQRGT